MTTCTCPGAPTGRNLPPRFLKLSTDLRCLRRNLDGGRSLTQGQSLSTKTLSHVSDTTKLAERPPEVVDFSKIWPTETEPNEKVSPARIHSAQSHRARSGKYQDLKSTRRLLPENRDTLVKAAQTTCSCCEHQDGMAIDCGARVQSLPASVHLVYSAIRTGIVKGYDGINMSGQELAKWLGLTARSVFRAVLTLRNLRLVTRTKHFENMAYTSARFVKALGRFVKGKEYQRIAVANSYAPGPAAPKCVPKARTPMTKRGCQSQGEAMTKSHSNSLPSSGRGGRPKPAARPHGVGQDSLASRPAASDGPANRRTVAPQRGAKGVLTAEEAQELLVSLPLGFLEPKKPAPSPEQSHPDEWMRAKWSRALRAADKPGGAN